MRTRLIIMGVALLLGGVAAVLAANYLSNARTEIAAESRPVEVLVAQEDIPRGLPAEELVAKKMVTLQKVPQRFAAAGAISTAKAIEGQVLASPLTKGEQLTPGRFLVPNSAGLAYSIPEDYVALAIPVDEVRGISRLVKPGDRVAVFGTFSPGPKGEENLTKMLLPDAKVLAMGGDLTEAAASAEGEDGQGITASRQNGGEAAPSNMTLSVSAEDAEKVVFAYETGKVWVVLLPATAEQPPSSDGQTIRTIFK